MVNSINNFIVLFQRVSYDENSQINKKTSQVDDNYILQHA